LSVISHRSAIPEAATHHDHVSESGEDIDNYKVAAVGLAGALLIAVAVLLVQALYLSFQRADTARKYARSATLTDYRSEQADKIGRYRWVDQKSGVVAIPIDRAMSLIAERMDKADCDCFEAFEQANGDLASISVLGGLYSKERLGSDTARRIFLLPDRAA